MSDEKEGPRIIAIDLSQVADAMFITQVSGSLAQVYEVIPPQYILKIALEMIDRDTETLSDAPRAVMQNVRSLIVLCMAFNECYDRGTELAKEAIESIQAVQAQEEKFAGMDVPAGDDPDMLKAMIEALKHMGQGDGKNAAN